MSLFWSASGAFVVLALLSSFILRREGSFYRFLSYVSLALLLLGVSLISYQLISGGARLVDR